MSDKITALTTEDKCVGIIPGFSWKFQKKVFHALAESICHDFGNSIEDFKRLGHIIIDENDEYGIPMEQRDFQLKNLCERFLDESYYLLCAIPCFLQMGRDHHDLAKPYPLIYEKITQKGRNAWNDDWEKVFIPFVEHAAEKLEEIKQKQKEPYLIPSPPVKYRFLESPHNKAISALCTYLLTVIDKRYSEYRTNKANMNTFLLGVHDKSTQGGKISPINNINPTYSFAGIRKNIGEFTGIV